VPTTLALSNRIDEVANRVGDAIATATDADAEAEAARDLLLATGVGGAQLDGLSGVSDDIAAAVGHLNAAREILSRSRQRVIREVSGSCGCY
jgi:hypothetical protein